MNAESSLGSIRSLILKPSPEPTERKYEILFSYRFRLVLLSELKPSGPEA